MIELKVNNEVTKDSGTSQLASIIWVVKACAEINMPASLEVWVYP